MSSCADPTADFVQPPPVLGNQYREDRVLRSHLHRVLPEAVIEACTGEYDELGADAARAWSDARLRTPEQPRLVQWDAWGTRIDRIETTLAPAGPLNVIVYFPAAMLPLPAKFAWKSEVVGQPLLSTGACLPVSSWN